jgi:arylsulfatase A-like enzyme
VPEAKRPNILFILADQLRRQVLSCYGDPNLESPNIDRLAKEGVRFDCANATYPVCVPYRFTLMTGHYAHSRQVPTIDWRMSPCERTLADELNEAGYETVYVGKWHLFGGLGPAKFKRPVPREFQGRWEKWLGFEFRNDFFDTVYFEDDDPTPKPLNMYQTDGLTDLAITHLTQNRDTSRPWCCMLSVEAPHPPIEAPEEYEEKWLARDIELPPSFMVGDEETDGTQAAADERVRNYRRNQLYYAMVDNLDWNVGRLMSALEEAGQLENTVVVLTSDHGEMGGMHRLVAKQRPYEESAGVPLIVWGPGAGIVRGKTVASPVATEDLFPTLLGLARLPGRTDLLGKDLSDLLGGDAPPPDRPGVMLELVAELRPNQTFHRCPWRAFRSDRYLYSVKGSGYEGGMKPWQFFDLHEDPYEMSNLADHPEYADLVRQHHRWLRERMEETGDTEWLAAAHGIPALGEWRVRRARG